MRIHVVTLFPECFGGPLACGPLKRARELRLLEVSLHRLRDYARGKHLTVDDVPYGGGQGMVMKPEALVAAIEHVTSFDRPRRILLAARGARLVQARVAALAREESLLLVCGRYEGVDERVTAWVDEELSIGDYVLSGGELGALVLMDAIARLLPGVLGNAASAPDDSFATGVLEHPQYTRPWEFRGRAVPDVLGSGDHGAIARWRRAEALRTTLERRPDLLAAAPLDDADRAVLRRLGWPGDDG
jgi:tRNA (guanine37-N1)-methyltransferase